MSFWNRKSKKETLPEVRKSDFIDETDPVENGRDSIITITYGTNMPIDVIYAYLKKDNETKGYDDAICNPDVSYKENYMALTRSYLDVLFRQVRTKYNDELRVVSSHIKSLSDAGLIDIVERFKARKETLELHIQELNQMENDLHEEKDYMTGVFKSYERGFLRGLATRALETLKNEKI
jgi:DNA-binding transcriptional ArsR family regulator